ncbi:hypothetical protein JCM3770_005690 [Rhodotorula araucariae]
MSSFAAALDRLLLHLAALPASSPPHLQHVAIRLQRAYSHLRAAGTPAPADLFVRIRSRLEELDDGVDEAQAAGLDPGHAPAWDKLRDEIREVLRDVDDLLARSSVAPTPASTAHSRTSSVDLPRRVPSTRLPTAPTPDPTADLDAFLSSATASRPLPPGGGDALSPLAAARAHALSDAYTLYRLATSPSSVLPPGESLGSVFRSSSASTDIPVDEASLEARISSQLHQAYFDSFARTLSPSSPAPHAIGAEQRAAWARLAQDLLDAVSPLIPSRLKTASGVPIRTHLAAALRAPDRDDGAEFDARSALEGVSEAVTALGRVCAPTRDNDVRALGADLEHAIASPAPARALVDLVRRTLELARDMEADMRRFRRGATRELAREEDFSAVVREEAAARERALVLDWFGGEEGVRRETREWCARVSGPSAGEDGTLSKTQVARALVDSVFADAPVTVPPLSSASATSAPPGPSPANLLPPVLVVVAPALFALQNRLQALTILACLLSLAPSAPPDRLWAILEAELAPPGPPLSAAPAEAAPTRVAHLADELLPRAPAPPASAAQEARLRAAVDRLLRYDDPVWRLLQGRLRTAARAAVVAAVEGEEERDGEGRRVREREGEREVEQAQAQAPRALRTGRARLSPPRPGAGEGSAAPHPRSAPVPLAVPKGFDRAPLLADQLRKAVDARLVREVWAWVDEVWGGVLGWRAATVESAGP